MLSDKLFRHLLRLRPQSMVYLHDGFGEGVMPHDRAKPCQLLSHDGCQERLLRTHKLRTVFGLELSVEKFPQALGLECLDSSLVVCQQSPRLTSV